MLFSPYSKRVNKILTDVTTFDTIYTFKKRKEKLKQKKIL